jgi:UDP-GlcNAc:undecaprenyl-phosphate GlcNAc-1-phosphate transferase
MSSSIFGEKHMPERLALFFSPLTSCLLTLIFVPLVRHFAPRWGGVALPTVERWHKKPTPSLGGVGFFLGFILSVFLFSVNWTASLPLLLVASLMFVLGLYDDLRHLTPTVKLLGQLIGAALAVSHGYSLGFFTWPPLDIVVTALWIIGLTNAFNLLDNMDGLAGGIGLIAALYLAFLFYYRGDFQHALLALTLAGAVMAFLFYNFYPASIFMGDAGSLFLGSTLSLLTLHVHGQASNIFSFVAVPTLILLVPILDTSLVTLTRFLRSQPISQGGADHSSHRLVVLGFTEPKAVLLLYLAAAISGAAAVLIEWLSYTLSLVLVPVVVLFFAGCTAYLARVEIASARTANTLPRRREKALGNNDLQ